MPDLFHAIDRTGTEAVRTEGRLTLGGQSEKAEAFDLDPLLGDCMVLQRNAVTRIWGLCDTEGEIAARIDGKTYYGRAEGGRFEVRLAPMPAGGPFDLTIFDARHKRTLRNVLIGEVFLLGGQSNMQMKLCEIEPDEEDLPEFDDDKIRLYEVGNCCDAAPRDRLAPHPNQSWRACTREEIRDFSAAGAYFGLRLRRMYPDLPVGLVLSAQGGTFLCTWLPEEEYNAGLAEGLRLNVNPDVDRFRPAWFYNAMIHPLRRFKYKAVVWYQGEGQPTDYDRGLIRLMTAWRQAFEDPNLGFVIVTLPRLVLDKYNNYVTVSPEDWFNVRLNQMKAAKAVEGAVYCVNIDLGHFDDIHPFDKKPVGFRAADAFVRKFYGIDRTLTGPVYAAHTVRGNVVEIRYDDVGSGLEIRHSGLGFEILGEDDVWHPAAAELAGKDRVRIASEAKVPKGFRYGCTNIYPSMTEEQARDVRNAVCLYNKEGYPAEPTQVRIE